MSAPGSAPSFSLIFSRPTTGVFSSTSSSPASSSTPCRIGQSRGLRNGIFSLNWMSPYSLSRTGRVALLASSLAVLFASYGLPSSSPSAHSHLSAPLSFFTQLAHFSSALPHIVTADAAYFYLQESKDKCFLENVPQHVPLTVTYANPDNPGELPIAR
eukprot:GHVT01077967.1.p1 GENE.GHVT01077967.1~~GHVT01077967.1.p1  ORF type:complete len:158 (+),score=25.19 GHVT01077967.1:348-821(+)